MTKTFLCRCEDITVAECASAVEAGYACFEDLKRFLGVGTGPCQGKSCVQAAMALVAAHRGIPLDEVDVMTFRPPVRPIPFATLAAPDAGDAEPAVAGPSKGQGPHAAGQDGPAPAAAQAAPEKVAAPPGGPASGEVAGPHEVGP